MKIEMGRVKMVKMKMVNMKKVKMTIDDDDDVCSVLRAGSIALRKLMQPVFGQAEVRVIDLLVHTCTHTLAHE